MTDRDRSAPAADGGRDALPHDHTQAILETTKRVASLLKASGRPFALAGSVAAYAHGVPARFQHDTDFCVRREDSDDVVAALEHGGIAMRQAPEDWLLKGSAAGEEIDLIFELARRPVDLDLLERAETRPVDSVWMPVLAPTDLMDSRLAALSEHYCDFGDLLPMARLLRERIDWGYLRRRHGRAPMPDAFLFLLERLDVITPDGRTTEGRATGGRAADEEDR
ncbi:nucleotidyltransferase family protein [Streptomyces sp. NRRL S-87]|uniref:nucleotidyltransferase family protein n=1 Tax=Streptomyces sp. NRRL S-87 TaxID=1463920 RepID=UPI00068FB6AB|nr:nucleotidyltransferase family protein [Streptomyces sp. NRRL S-87]